MKRIISVLLVFSFLFTLCSCINKDVPTIENNERITLVIGEREFTVLLEENETAEVFKKSLPVSLLMTELNGNEKYHYLDYALPNNEQSFVKINKGDVMLYGDRCIVVFYKSFVTAYRYTKIGQIENTDLLEEAIGEGNVLIEFKN